MIPEVDNIGIITLDPSKSQEYQDRINHINCFQEKDYRFLANGLNGKSSSLLVSTKSRLYPFWNQNKPDSDEFWNREMTQGEIGCVMSHINMWLVYAQAFNQQPDYPYKDSVIIFEEDFYPAEDIIDWSRMDELKDYKWDILFLGRRLQKGETDTEVGLKHFVQPGFCYQAHAYILSAEGLNKLINYYIPVLKRNLIPTDEFLPATYMDHPREDINRLFPIKRMKALATRYDWFIQTDWEGTGRSRTAPNEVEL